MAGGGGNTVINEFEMNIFAFDHDQPWPNPKCVFVCNT